MLRYICQHCLTDLGEVVPGELVPQCPAHPDGAVQVVDDADPQPE